MELKDKISKFAYLRLKKQLKIQAGMTTAIRKAAQLSFGDVRYAMRNLKRDKGQETRELHLALCFLRGRTYKECEPNVSEDNIFPKEYLDKLFRRCWDGQLIKYIQSSQYEKDMARFYGYEVDDTTECIPTKKGSFIERAKALLAV